MNIDETLPLLAHTLQTLGVLSKKTTSSYKPQQHQQLPTQLGDMGMIPLINYVSLFVITPMFNLPSNYVQDYCLLANHYQASLRTINICIEQRRRTFMPAPYKRT